MLKGKTRSFKLLGDQSMVTYVVMDASAGLTEEEVESFKERWGDKAADDLIMRDLASIRFDGAVFEANYDAIVEALQSLPKDVLENLFKPMLMKAKPGAVEAGKKYAKSAEGASGTRSAAQDSKLYKIVLPRRGGCFMFPACWGILVAFWLKRFLLGGSPCPPHPTFAPCIPKLRLFLVPRRSRVSSKMGGSANLKSMPTAIRFISPQIPRKTSSPLHAPGKTAQASPFSVHGRGALPPPPAKEGLERG